MRCFHRIIAAAKKYNIDSTGFEQKWGTRLDSLDVDNASAARRGEKEAIVADDKDPEKK